MANRRCSICERMIRIFNGKLLAHRGAAAPNKLCAGSYLEPAARRAPTTRPAETDEPPKAA